jgi:hypothetical protein
MSSSPNAEHGERSVGASSFVRSSAKSAIKALSTSRFLARDRAINDGDEAEWHGQQQFAEESSSATGRDEGTTVSLTEIPSQIGSGFIEPEVRLGTDESARSENGRSKMLKIRSMHGDDLEERDMEVSLFQERRYPEVRSALADFAPSSWMSANLGDNLTVPAFHVPRSNRSPVSDGGRRGKPSGRQQQPFVRMGGDHFSRQTSQDLLPPAYPRPATAGASEVGITASYQLLTYSTIIV